MVSEIVYFDIISLFTSLLIKYLRKKILFFINVLYIWNINLFQIIWIR